VVSTRSDRRADARTWAGYRHASFARSTGTLVVLVHSAEQGIEDDPDLPWTLLCDDHDSCVCFERQSDAWACMSQPEMFCDDCRDLTEPQAASC
jgi:hypothetical protein